MWKFLTQSLSDAFKGMVMLVSGYILIMYVVIPVLMTIALLGAALSPFVIALVVYLMVMDAAKKDE
jgi:hypothetical protein